jgi:hypothetical protein
MGGNIRQCVGLFFSPFRTINYTDGTRLTPVPIELDITFTVELLVDKDREFYVTVHYR